MTTIPRCHQRTRRACALLALLLAFLAARSVDAQECSVATGDFCVCCPPSDCRREQAVCPGGAGGLILLKSRNPVCAVNPFDAARCRSGGVIASEQTSALGVFTQGQRTRIELSQAQLDALVAQLEALRR